MWVFQAVWKTPTTHKWSSSGGYEAAHGKKAVVEEGVSYNYAASFPSAYMSCPQELLFSSCPKCCSFHQSRKHVCGASTPSLLHPLFPCQGQWDCGSLCCSAAHTQMKEKGLVFITSSLFLILQADPSKKKKIFFEGQPCRKELANAQRKEL